MPVIAPKTDELIARHQFYAEVAVKLSQDENAAQTRSRLHQRVDEVTTTANKAKEELSTIATQKRTVMAMMIGIWSVGGGLVMWGFDKVSTTINTNFAQIEVHKKKIEEFDRMVVENKDKQKELGELKKLAGSLQSDVDTLKFAIQDLQQKGKK